MISYVLPTRDRHDELACTLGELGALALNSGLGRTPEVIVVDNASGTPARAPKRLANGVPVRLIRLGTNEGAAARNVGVRAASTAHEWVVMLDDDSAPIGADHLDALAERPADALAVTADITLADGSRERGGLPEVPIGCGVAVRRGAFLEVGGYDPSFGYYAEEYDLAAKLLLEGGRIEFEPRFRVAHRKTTSGRDFGLILGRLVRNNGWVIQRYCPGDCLTERLEENETRYRAIGAKERAEAGFERGLAELRETIGAQRRTPMSQPLWDRFTGLEAARAAIGSAHDREAFSTAALVERGKNDWAVETALRERGVRIVASGAEACVVATMSPGPMLDAAERLAGAGRRVVLPWITAQTSDHAGTGRSRSGLPAA